MRLLEWKHVVDNEQFTASAEFKVVEEHVTAAVKAVRWPPAADDFALNPTVKGNGVKPIKNGFVAYLKLHGWAMEFDRFDCHYTYPESDSLPFAVEWETGNISSSHRAINRLALGMVERRITGGILILPSRDMYKFLTDRIGNAQELLPYHRLWVRWQGDIELPYLGIITVEHDRIDAGAPLIKKGTDGRALL
jgi:hypothetical protein